jgi:DNA-directed RNA polymerase specialized sigma24 family protein
LNEEGSRANTAELALHQRLLAGDVTAPAEAAEQFLEPLTRRLTRTHPGVRDPQLVEQAAIDTVLDYVQHPHHYQPQRSSLEAYLRMAAGRDLSNALRGEQRHTLRAVPLDDAAGTVELALAAGNSSVEDQVLDGLGVELPRGLSRFEALRLVHEEFPGAADRRLLLLVLEGERRTSAYAEAMGLAAAPGGQQRLEVKRSKDRIKKRLQRFRAKLGIAPERRP